jgi:hypothetical protein
MDIHRQNVEAFRSELEEGLLRPPVPIPDHRTVEPRLLSSTNHVGALDGSDQQMFAVETNPEWGVGVWTTLYVEHAVHSSTHEVYREGPSSHLWSDEELLFYHLTINLPNPDKNKQFLNDYHSIRQILSSARATEPPILKVLRQSRAEGVREEAARERATGEWLSLRSVIIRHLPPQSLLLKDGRFNCQIEQSASWVDQMGRQAARNNIRVIAVVKSGALYAHLSPIIQAIARTTNRPFYFPVPNMLIDASYQNETYPVRKTLMVGGKDHTDLAGIGALWTAFCPDPANFKTFVILEFNLYDLHHYKALAREPKTLRNWHIRHLGGTTHPTATGIQHIHATDLQIHETDFENLVEPTLSEILWLCEQEIGRFGYPNLLGIAHHDVVLTQKKVALLRKRYMEILAHSDIILSDLVGNEFVETPHKLHNIY